MNRIRQCRKAAAMTQLELAKAVNVCRPAVARWETGRSDPNWNLAPLLARVLGCKIGDLFEQEKEVKSDEGQP